MMRSNIDKVGRFVGSAWAGWQTSYGYFRQIWVGPFHLNIFIAPDPGEAMHDHPWWFVSFPFVSYVEDYLDADGTIKRQVIPRFRFNHQPKTHTHRILGAWSGEYRDGVPTTGPGIAWTLAYMGPVEREFSYWREHKGKIRKYPWKAYLRRVGDKPTLEG